MNLLVLTCLCSVLLVLLTPAPLHGAPLHENPFGGYPLLTPNDVLVDPNPDLKSGIINPRYRWPGGVVIYELDPNFTQAEISIINAALAEVSSKTCITFQQRVDEVDHVFVVRGAPGSGCNSYIGRIGGKQNLNLQVNPGGGHCIWQHTIAHEFIHAIGFRHEQGRFDRDDFVEINYGNIPPELHYAFDKYDPLLYDVFGVAYDYGSVMHYGAYDFAINPSIPTIIPKDPGAVIGGTVVTESDVAKINNMYNGYCP